MESNKLRLVPVRFIKYSASAMLSACIDILGFYLIFVLLDDVFELSQRIAITLAAFSARAVSSIFNFLVNKNLVFGRKGVDGRRMLLKYYALCAFSVLMSSQLVALISSASFITGAVLITMSKLVVDSALFITNYIIQKRLVFK
jgi:putative flippase GtrA